MHLLFVQVCTVLATVVSVRPSPVQLVPQDPPKADIPVSPVVNFAPGPNARQNEFHVEDYMNVPGHSHTSFGHAPVNLASAPEPPAAEPYPLYNSNRYSGLGTMEDDSGDAGATAASADTGDPKPSVTLTFTNADGSAQPTKPAGLAFGDNASEYILPSPLSDELPLDGPQQALAAPATTVSASNSISIPSPVVSSAWSTLTVPFDAATTPSTLTVPPPASFSLIVSTVTESMSVATITSLVSISASIATSTSASNQPSSTPSTNIAAAKNDVDQVRIRNIFIGIGAFFVLCGILFLFRKRILNKMCGPTQPRTEDEEFWVDTREAADADLGPKSAQVGLDTAIEKHRESLQINSPIPGAIARPQTPGSNYTPTPKMQATSPVVQQWMPPSEDRYTPLPPPRQPFSRTTMRVDSPAPGVATAGMFGGRVTPASVQGAPGAALTVPPALAPPPARASIHPGDLWPGSRPY